MKAQKGLDAAGITLPNFKNVSRELAKEPTPEPEETEEDRIERELHEVEDTIIELQSAVRGALVRDRVRWINAKLNRCESGIIGLQSIFRGQTVRALFKEHLHDYRTTVNWATMVILKRSELMVGSSGFERRCSAKRTE